MADRIQATPQNPALGAVARALRRAQEFAGQYQVLPQVPLLGGMGIDELLSLPGAASLMEDVSYNGPRAVIRGGNVATGGLGTYKLDPRVADVADVAMTVSPLAAVAGRRAGRGAMALGRAGERLAERVVPPIMERGGLGAQALEALATGSRSQVIKPKGGNWLAGSVERALGPLKRNVEGEVVTPEMAKEHWDVASVDLFPDAAINKWIDTKLTKYIKNEMSTPEDPVRALAERGVLHFEPQMAVLPSDTAFARTAAGYPRHGIAKSRLAQDWETLADAPFGVERAGDLVGKMAHPSKVELANPWLAKVPPETPVYNMSPGSTMRNENLGFGHLIDELRNAVNPESGLPRELLWKYSDLDKVTVPQAVQRVSDINQWRAAQKAEADLALAGNAATVEHRAYDVIPGTDLPNERGLRWVELKMPAELPEGWELGQSSAFGEPTYRKVGATEASLEHPGRSFLEDALKYEGETMGHCVGGYCPDVLEGRSRIYSLRDAKGEPHVTVETKPGRQLTERDMPDDVRDMLAEQYGDASREEFEAAVQSYLRQRSVPEEITQIKGKANRAPKEEYLPFVQDFVRSGQWGRVGDIRNAGLVEGGRHRLLGGGEEINLPGYYTREEFPSALRRAFAEANAPAESVEAYLKGMGFARGGAVRSGPATYDPDRIAALAEQLMSMEA